MSISTSPSEHVRSNKSSESVQTEPGYTLAQFLNGQAQPAPSSARLVLQLASSLQKAHEQGKIHGHLQPACILLEPLAGSSDTLGLDRFQPKITDFEKAISPDSVGTSYLAPEQLTRPEASASDSRIDIYAQGIILYELLTGRPPLKSISLVDTIKLINHEQPIPPSSLEPTVPRTLENICLKCIEKVPSKRYSSAQELADDLVRFLEGKPAKARPISRFVRAWRWSKRHPGWAIASSLLFLMLLAAAVIGLLLASQEHERYEEAERQTRRAIIEGKHARESLVVAGKAMEVVCDGLLMNRLVYDPTEEMEHKARVAFVIPWLEQFVQQESSTDVLKFRQSHSLMHLAMVQAVNKQVDKADGSFRRAQKLLKDLKASESVSEVDILKALSTVYLEFGKFQNGILNQYENAEKSFRTSLEYLDKLADLKGIETCYDSYSILHLSLAHIMTYQRMRASPSRFGLARSTANQEVRPVVEGAEVTGDISDEESHYLKAIAYCDKLLESHPDRDDMVKHSVSTHDAAAYFYRHQNDKPKEIRELRKARDSAKKVSQSKSKGIETSNFLLFLHGDLARGFIKLDLLEEGLEQMRQAKKLCDALAIAYPANGRFAAGSVHWEKELKKYEKPKAP